MPSNVSRMVKISEDLSEAIDARRAVWEERNPVLSAGADRRRADFRALAAGIGGDPVLSLALDNARSRFSARPSHWFEDIGVSPDDDQLLRDFQKALEGTKRRVPSTPNWSAEQMLYMLHAWPRSRAEFEAYQRRSSWAAFVHEVLRAGILGWSRTERSPYDDRVNEREGWNALSAKTLKRGPLF